MSLFKSYILFTTFPGNTAVLWTIKQLQPLMSSQYKVAKNLLYEIMFCPVDSIQYIATVHVHYNMPFLIQMRQYLTLRLKH